MYSRASVFTPSSPFFLGQSIRSYLYLSIYCTVSSFTQPLQPQLTGALD